MGKAELGEEEEEEVMGFKILRTGSLLYQTR